MEQHTGFNIFCSIAPNKLVLIDAPEPGERNEEEDGSDNRIDDQVDSTPTETDPDVLPEFEDLAHEAVSSLTEIQKKHDAYLSIDEAGKTQHKATILRIFSSRFSVPESRDRLKRACAWVYPPQRDGGR